MAAFAKSWRPESERRDGGRAMPQPAHPKIYHIVHVDCLASIVADGGLDCDTVMAGRQNTGPKIGMEDIKQRRRGLPIDCRPGLCVGECVPFYFCPRSVMLYLPIVHLVCGYQGEWQWRLPS
jgi:hypothetical protein